jgi:hypothetical protein
MWVTRSEEAGGGLTLLDVLLWLPTYRACISQGLPLGVASCFRNVASGGQSCHVPIQPVSLSTDSFGNPGHKCLEKSAFLLRAHPINHSSCEAEAGGQLYSTA